MGANANSLDQKTWPMPYGGRGYFYIGEGGTLGAAPGKDPSNSYIWDRLSRQGISYRNYGFWATGTPPVTVYNEPHLYASTDVAFPGYNLAIQDQARYREWELILGLRPMTQFDAAATPMFNSFTDDADFSPYQAEKPEQSLTEPNPRTLRCPPSLPGWTSARRIERPNGC